VEDCPKVKGVSGADNGVEDWPKIKGCSALAVGWTEIGVEDWPNENGGKGDGLGVDGPLVTGLPPPATSGIKVCTGAPPATPSPPPPPVGTKVGVGTPAAAVVGTGGADVDDSEETSGEAMRGNAGITGEAICGREGVAGLGMSGIGGITGEGTEVKEGDAGVGMRGKARVEELDIVPFTAGTVAEGVAEGTPLMFGITPFTVAGMF